MAPYQERTLFSSWTDLVFLKGTHLVVITISDGIGLDPSLFHLKQDPNSQDGLAVLTT